MGRAPCCEKVGLKKGRWTAEEDEKLTKYIQANGEGSWRSLPKNAGTCFFLSLFFFFFCKDTHYGLLIEHVIYFFIFIFCILKGCLGVERVAD
jgi:hypothetical protein